MARVTYSIDVLALDKEIERVMKKLDVKQGRLWELCDVSLYAYYKRIERKRISQASINKLKAYLQVDQFIKEL